nr:GH92 family glycosyl hydrolase [uncultured Draconibacterium sp.]
MINSIKYIIFIALFFVACSKEDTKSNTATKDPVDYVNPYIGNISHLLVPTFPTIHLPNSLLRVYPERGDFAQPELHALPLIVTSHRGSSAFSLSPFQGNESGLKPVIHYSYDLEKLTPYSYSVYLDQQEINVKYGLSHQSAAYEIRYKKDEPAYLVLSSRNGTLKWDGKSLSGYQLLNNNTKVYIYLILNEKPGQVYQLADGKLTEANKADGNNSALVLKYPKETKQLNIHYGISFIDEVQANANMEREVSGKSVAELQNAGRKIWNDELGKIKVDGGTEDNITVFYTSLYRCYERPVCISEGGRYYSAFDGKVHDDDGRPFYTDDWIWDSYRAHHPLRVLIDSEKEEDILNSFVLMSEQMNHFWWPTFPEITGDSRRMNSNHGVASVIDAYRKGLTNFDIEKAYEACKRAITEKTLSPWSGKPAGELDEFYKKHGFIPALHEGEEETVPEVNRFERRQTVAVTLGTSYDEWCLAQIAKELGKEEDYEYFSKASFNYRNLFHPETKFFHPKDQNEKFIEPFDYRFSGGIGARDYYDENNGWTYRWDVQHNIPDLISLMGGKNEFAENLDALFTTPMGRGKREFYTQLPDQTGNVGQFTMANEPSLHIPYLYNYAGQPWKTQKLIRNLLHEWFRNDLMGIPGDEDGGGLTSFVVFSSMGFYPVTPGNPKYSLGSPLFEQISIDLGNGKTFEIRAHNVSADNKYIQSATMSGKQLNKPGISHEDIMNGGVLDLTMDKFPNKKLWN